MPLNPLQTASKERRMKNYATFLSTSQECHFDFEMTLFKTAAAY